MCRRTLTGAWIETRKIHNLNSISLVAPSRVRGLKLKLKVFPFERVESHPHGCVD